MTKKDERLRALRGVGQRKKPISYRKKVAANAENSALARADPEHDALAGGQDMVAFGWAAEYEELCEAWPWKQAAYIAWASSPAQGRLPATQAELADLLGLRTDRTIRQWREKEPRILAEIKARQAGPLWRQRRDIFEALVASAATPDPANHADRKLALEMLGDYVPRAKQELTVGVPVAPFTSDEMAAARGELEAWEQANDGEPGGEAAAD
jgi:hypothetical protein